MINEAQDLAARIRATYEVVKVKYRRRCHGGWQYTKPTADIREEVAELVGVTPSQVWAAGTYARSCTHPWSQGACDSCPPADHIFAH